MRATSGVNVFALAIFIPLLMLGLIGIGSMRGTLELPTLHLVLMSMVMVSGLVFWSYAVQSFRIAGGLRMFIIAFGLFFAALLFLGHSLFGDAFGIQSLERAEWYNRIAVLALSLVLLLAVGFSERKIKVAERRGVLIAGAVLLLISLVIAFWMIEEALIAQVSVAAGFGRWTPLGRFLQAASILFFTVAAIRYLYGAFLIRSEVALAFATGAVLFMMGEISFALAQPHDAFFWVSHLWYVFGYLAFVWGGYAARVTHQEGSSVG